jgi:hypothetical protein
VIKSRLLAQPLCALLVLTACGGPYSDAAPQLLPASATSAPAGEPVARNDNRRALGNDLTITISTPKSFTPTDTAYPRTPRAVAFELTIDNDGTGTYRASQLAVTATCNSADALQVIDSTQGYTGFVGATDNVPPGQSLRVVVAFAVPAERAVLRLNVQPDASGGSETTVFEGSV